MTPTTAMAPAKAPAKAPEKAPAPSAVSAGTRADLPPLPPIRATAKPQGRHRAPESTDEPSWATPAVFRAAWGSAGPPTGTPGADGLRDGPTDPFTWLGRSPAAG